MTSEEEIRLECLRLAQQLALAAAEHGLDARDTITEKAETFLRFVQNSVNPATDNSSEG